MDFLVYFCNFKYCLLNCSSIFCNFVENSGFKKLDNEEIANINMENFKIVFIKCIIYNTKMTSIKKVNNFEKALI